MGTAEFPAAGQVAMQNWTLYYSRDKRGKFCQLWALIPAIMDSFPVGDNSQVHASEKGPP